MEKNGYTPLHYAVERGFIETVSLLINNGADLESKTDVSIFVSILF